MWDSSHKMYKIIDKKNDAWKETSRKLNVDLCKAVKRVTHFLRVPHPCLKLIEPGANCRWTSRKPTITQLVPASSPSSLDTAKYDFIDVD